jgi:hypothetical protein
MVRDYLGYKPASPADGPAQPDTEAVQEAASMMAERPLDTTQAATLAILKAKGWA